MQNETITFKHTEKATGPGQKTVCGSNVDPDAGDENNIPNNNQAIFEEHRKEGNVISLSALKEKGFGTVDFKNLGLDQLSDDTKQLIKDLKLNIHGNKNGRLIGKLTIKNRQDYRDKNGRRLPVTKLNQVLKPIRSAGVHIYVQKVNDKSEVFEQIGEDGYTPGRHLVKPKVQNPLDKKDHRDIQHFLDFANANIYKVGNTSYLHLYNVVNNDFFKQYRKPLLEKFIVDKFDDIIFHSDEYEPVTYLEGVEGRNNLPPETSMKVAEAADDFTFTLLEKPDAEYIATYQMFITTDAAEKYEYDPDQIQYYTSIFKIQKNVEVYQEYDIELV